ncbi:MAG: hypothetical protein OHK0032_06880 [Thermodesulfovibrionales bacterium]
MNGRKLIVAVMLLFMLSLTAIVIDRYLWKGHEVERIRSFQRYVCGLGLGASISPDWGFISYDPRVDYVDETNLWPIPSGYIYSPQRGLSVGDIKEIRMR